MLIIAFIVFTALVILISIYISNRITQPISELAALLGTYRIGDTTIHEKSNSNTYEIDYLNTKFTELVSRVNNAYTFQKNSIHHISHQLKTPISILISELERIKFNTNQIGLQQELDKQIAKTKSLAEIINTLLEISKIEAGQSIEKMEIRYSQAHTKKIQTSTLLRKLHLNCKNKPKSTYMKSFVITLIMAGSPLVYAHTTADHSYKTNIPSEIDLMNNEFNSLGFDKSKLPNIQILNKNNFELDLKKYRIVKSEVILKRAGINTYEDLTDAEKRDLMKKAKRAKCDIVIYDLNYETPQQLRNYDTQKEEDKKNYFHFYFIKAL